MGGLSLDGCLEYSVHEVLPEQVGLCQTLARGALNECACEVAASTNVSKLSDGTVDAYHPSAPSLLNESADDIKGVDNSMNCMEKISSAPVLQSKCRKLLSERRCEQRHPIMDPKASVSSLHPIVEEFSCQQDCGNCLDEFRKFDNESGNTDITMSLEAGSEGTSKNPSSQEASDVLPRSPVEVGKQ